MKVVCIEILDWIAISIITPEQSWVISAAEPYTIFSSEDRVAFITLFVERDMFYISQSHFKRNQTVFVVLTKLNKKYVQLVIKEEHIAIVWFFSGRRY